MPRPSWTDYGIEKSNIKPIMVWVVDGGHDVTLHATRELALSKVAGLIQADGDVEEALQRYNYLMADRQIKVYEGPVLTR